MVLVLIRILDTVVPAYHLTPSTTVHVSIHFVLPVLGRVSFSIHFNPEC